MFQLLIYNRLNIYECRKKNSSWRGWEISCLPTRHTGSIPSGVRNFYFCPGIGCMSFVFCPVLSSAKAHTFLTTAMMCGQALLWRMSGPALWVGSVKSCALQSRHESTRLWLIPKLKAPMRVDGVFLLWKSFLPTLPKLFDTWIKVVSWME